MGMDEASAAMLVKQTMLGSFHLMNNADKTLDELILSVKSKGGTTEQAINTFNDNGFTELVKKALQAANDRSISLANDLGAK